jgi:L-alanine-DL-glutamate epimerase-like enolase superfamily enzyme
VTKGEGEASAEPETSQGSAPRSLALPNTMKITRVETIPIRVPIKPWLAIKYGRGGSHVTSPFLLVRIETNGGLTGVGEVSCTPRWSGEDQYTAKHFVDEYFAPLLIGQDPTADTIESITAHFADPVAGNHFTKAGVEMALWDLLGKSRGVPVYELLGGKVPGRTFVATKWSVSGVAPDRAAEIARWAVDQGFKKMKVKVGIDPAQDVDRVRAVRLAVGPQVHLGVDANGGWQTPDVAIPVIEKLVEQCDIYFVEQPVTQGDSAGMAQVRRAVAPLPVIADESVYSIHDARALAAAGACDVFSIYIGKAGGIAPARVIADFAKSAGITCTIGSNLELGVGSAAMTHVALATGRRPGPLPLRHHRPAVLRGRHRARTAAGRRW